jgi:hypothetical protein
MQNLTSILFLIPLLLFMYNQYQWILHAKSKVQKVMLYISKTIDEPEDKEWRLISKEKRFLIIRTYLYTYFETIWLFVGLFTEQYLVYLSIITVYTITKILTLTRIDPVKESIDVKRTARNKTISAFVVLLLYMFAIINQIHLKINFI